MELEFRKGNNKDREWLFSLYSLTMKPHIEKTWGWNEEYQNDVFSTNLHPSKFIIISNIGVNVGAYLVDIDDDKLWLEMLLVKPEKQNKGIGSSIISRLKEQSVQMKLPLKLSVIKSNPVLPFYSELGFSVYDEDSDFFKMEWVLKK